MMTRVVDHTIVDDPELIRKRKEARRNMTAKERQEMLMQAAERAMKEDYEKFKQVSYEHLLRQREAKERKKKEAEKSAEPDDKL
jgi:hypothetical protein